MKAYTVFLLLLASSLNLLASTDPTQEAQECFEWLSTLNLPDFAESPFAEVWTDYDSINGDEAPAAYSFYGFITNESETEFTVLSLDLIQITLKKTKPGAPAHKRIAYENRPLPENIAETLKLLDDTSQDHPLFQSDWIKRKADLFVLGYTCWRRGNDRLAIDLFTEAKEQPLKVYIERETRTLQELLEIHFGRLAIWDAILRCGGSRLGTQADEYLPNRTELLKAFQRVIDHFPRSKEIDRAKKSAAILKQMIAEDSKHPRLKQQLDQLPLEQRINELIWQLRDQNGYQFFQPGSCDIFWTRDPGMTLGIVPSYIPIKQAGTSPAHQLLAIGYPAVPALIEALEDQRFSRSVGYSRYSYFNHTVLSVGDCALQILNRIAGYPIYSPTYMLGDASSEDYKLARQEAVEKWWGEFQQKGKKQMLIDAIAAGTNIPGSLIRELKVVAPASVENAITTGLTNAHSDWLRNLYSDELAHLKGTETPQAKQPVEAKRKI